MLTSLFKSKQRKQFDRMIEKLTLTNQYIDFLNKIPKKGLTIYHEEFVNYLTIYGWENLQQAQEGYSFNPQKNETIKEWNESYLVIASDSGDPYVIDLSKEDSPVLMAEHGTGNWKFRVYLESVAEFIKRFELINN